LRYDAVPRWVQERARRHDVRISPRAADELAQVAGPELRALDSELAKLAAYVGSGGSIDVEDIRELVHGGGPGIFTFLDALAERRPTAALGAAHGLLNRGTDPSELFAQIVALVRRLLVVKELVAQHRSVAAEAPTFGLTSSRFALEKLQRQAAHLAMRDLEDAYAVLRDVDMAIKTGRLDAEVAVELVVAHLAGIAPDLPPTSSPQGKWTTSLHFMNGVRA
jgi:DNA polymerase-3 subunit delta